MSDLKLVSPDQPTALEQRLLEAVRSESPSAEQRARVRLALGLPALAPVPVPVAAAGRRTWILKAGAGLVVASAAVIALLTGIARKPSSVESPPPALLAQPTPAAPLAELPAAPPAELPAEPPDATLVPPAAQGERASPGVVDGRDAIAPSKRAKKSPVVESGADLSEQLRLIDAARSAVAAGNASAAAAALTSYRTRFPRGPFGQEAAVLQIETLDLQGNHAQAAAQARSFLARHPNSPHVSVVQRIAGR
jgi:TolA-binding protein